jgi:hypothetical protein
MRISLLTPLLLTLFFVIAGNAFGQQIDPSALYNIIARHSERCLEVSGDALRNGDLVIQRDCDERLPNQKWKIIPAENGYYKIIANYSGKCLDVFGGIFSTGNGVIVEQWDCNAAANQRWWLWPIGNDYYKIQARHSNSFLDISGGPGATGNNIKAQQWQYVDGSNQVFRLTVARR